MSRRLQPGDRFGRLTVQHEEAYDRPVGHPRRYRCLCDCGKTAYVQGRHLTNGIIKSCGCQRP